MISTREFRNIVDSLTDKISGIKDNLPELYEYIGLPQSQTCSIEAILKEIYRKIGSSFASEHKLVWRHCKQLEDELILDHILHGEPILPYLSILERIRDATRRPAESQSMSDNWHSAIGAAYDHVKLQSWGEDSERIARLYSREFAVANAASRLAQRGFPVQITEGHPRMEPSVEGKLVQKLEKMIRAIGGINVAKGIFKLIEPFYDQDQERFHLVRRVSTTGTDKITPQAPFGYLLNLAVKYSAAKCNLLDIEPKWRELIEMSTDYATLFNVQPYSMYESMFRDSISLIPFLQEVALYDTLFGIQQIRPRDAIKIAFGVFDWLDVDERYEGTWTINEVLTVAESILKIGQIQHGPFVIDVKTYHEFKGITQQQIQGIVESVLSHPLPGANIDYSKPTDLPGPDFFKHPLLPITKDNYCLLSASACSPAVIEALFCPLRKLYKEFDKKIGLAIERFLRREFEKRGVNVYGGEYRTGGQDGECDLVIETDDTVIFIEVKKKPLTRQARAGSDIGVLLDLAGSLLQGQLQAGHHEVNLRKAGYIDLNVDGQCKRLSLNGRAIERIAVTLFDYGGFQDRMLLQQFLNVTLQSEYLTHDASMQSKLTTVNKQARELRDQVDQLLELNPDSERQPFFHCWFLSVPQLLIILDSVTDNNSFKKALWNTRHLYYGALDFYFEHATANKMRNTI